MAFKLWHWIFEFRLRRKKDDEKISFIVKSLLSELEAQGIDISYGDDHKGCAIFLWMYAMDDSVRLDVGGSRIECGKYIPKERES